MAELWSITDAPAARKSLPMPDMGGGSNWSNNAMGVLSLASIATGFLNATSQAASYKQQADYQKQQYEFNAALSEVKAKDALWRGALLEKRLRKEGSQVTGAQRANLAAQGIEVNSGTAMDIQSDTARMIEDDVIMARNNAWREAWGYRVEATGLKGSANFAGLAGEAAAKQTLITGASSAFSAGARDAYVTWGRG